MAVMKSECSFSMTGRGVPESKRGFDRVYGGQQTERGKELWTYTKQNFAKIAEDIGALRDPRREAL
jgi:hypothetical protein